MTSKTPSKLHDALDRFLVQLEANGRSQHTVAQYRRHVLLLLRWLDEHELPHDPRRVGHEDIAAFFASSLARCTPGGVPKQPTSTNALRSSIRCFFRYLHDAGVTAENPARLLQRARCQPRLSRALDEDEQARLMKVLDRAQTVEERRDRALFMLMFRTGIRVGSAVALDRDDIDLERAELTLRRAKGNSVDRVFLPSRVVALLEELAQQQHENGPLFRGKTGRRLTTRHVRRRFAKLLSTAQVYRVRGTHCLRHSFASAIYRKTRDIFLVKRALCHRSISSTVLYAQDDDDRLRRLIS